MNFDPTAKRKSAAHLSREPRQVRAEEALAKISAAVISILADEGPSSLTHRRVAQVARVPLASTTYYYDTKFAMIADATGRLLQEYVHSFATVAERHRAGNPVVPDLPSLIRKLLVNAAGRHGKMTLAWCEIMLDCARSQAGHLLARQWLEEMDKVWFELATELDVEQAGEVVSQAIDTVMGLLVLTKSLDLSPAQILALLRDRCAFEAVITPRPSQQGQALDVAARSTSKPISTRSRILDSAVHILLSGEPGPLSYRAVAERSGLTSAAVAYHFPTLAALLEAAQRRLFGMFLDRYTEFLSITAKQHADSDTLTDLVNVIFVREMSEGGAIHLAALRIWLDASRNVALRPLVSDFTVKFVRQWAAWLETIGAPARHDYSLIALGHYIGKCIRLLSTGVATRDLARARKGFMQTFQQFAQSKSPFAD